VGFDQQEMATNYVQRFIDQHSLLFVALFPVSFAARWLLVGAISFIEGWFSWSKLYQRRVPFKAQSGRSRAVRCDG